MSETVNSAIVSAIMKGIPGPKRVSKTELYGPSGS